MKLTYLGHNAHIIEVNDKVIMVDPFFPEGLPDLPLSIDYLILTHAHQDHILNAEEILKTSGCKVIANYEVTSFFIDKGFEGLPLNHGGDITIDDINIKAVNAVHSSSFPDGSYGGNPVGFVITGDNKTIYLAGDTALTWDMKLIPLTSPKLDLAILPIGNTFTMGYKDARLAAEFVDCKKVLGCHFDTFPPIKIDKDAAIQYFKEGGYELILLDNGANITV
jgi:L-ascorbate metabolism protein UlaG (beta-lactamase superfamily)